MGNEFISDQEKAYREWRRKHNVDGIKAGVLTGTIICRLMWCRENFPNRAIELDNEGSPVPVTAKRERRPLLSRIFGMLLGA